MADRLSKINGVLEYETIHKDRLTKLNAMVECETPHINRLSKIMVMVEYAFPISRSQPVYLSDYAVL